MYNLISEALQGLRQIRLSSMEQFWRRRLFESRNRQQDLMWTVSLQFELLNFVADLGPVLFASATISLYAYRTGHLSPAVAFTSLNLFGNLHSVIRRLPHRYAALFRSHASFQRLQVYLQLREQVQQSSSSHKISLHNASVAWPGYENEPVLRKVDLTFPENELSLVVGKVGSGKSLLLAAILEEAIVSSGKFKRPQRAAVLNAEKRNVVSGTTAYVSQPPWIEDATIRDNIIFGYDFDESRYGKVLNACALRYDLETLSDGEHTTAGIGGSILSGGQKWRVALARALYSPAAIIVLEDILGAVDAPIARTICDNALTGELAHGRTIILATHHPDYLLELSGYLVTVEDGSASGAIRPIAQSTPALDSTRKFPTLTKAENTAEEKGNQSQEAKKVPPVNAKDYWRILLVYIQTGGNLRGYIVGVFIVLAHRVLSAGHSWWLAKWTSSHDLSHQHGTTMNIMIYLAFSVASTIVLTLQTLLFTSIGYNSSRLLFERLVNRVLNAKLSWIDSASPGQVVQTLSSDMYTISHRMAPQLIGIVSSILQIVFICTTRQVSRLPLPRLELVT